MLIFAMVFRRQMAEEKLEGSIRHEEEEEEEKESLMSGAIFVISNNVNNAKTDITWKQSIRQVSCYF